MGQSKVWDLLNQLMQLLIVTILAVLVWRTLDRIETQGKANAAKQNSTLEAIRQRMGNDELWKQVKPELEKSSLQNK